MVLKITNLHILRYLPTYWLYLLERYTIDNQRCTHTASDTVTKDMESCFSTDCQETYNQTPVSFTFITPETEKLFRPENYPERFSKWFEKFVEHVTYNL